MTVTHRDGVQDVVHHDHEGSPVSSRSFKDVLLGMDTRILEEGNKSHLKFSYVEASTKEWLERSLVGRLRSMVHTGSIQREAMELSMVLTLAPVRELYCIISFVDVKSRDRSLEDNSTWFVI